MNYHLAELNVAQFMLPMEHPNNIEFIDNLDRVNAIAESQPGFVWRLTGDGNDATDLQAFENPNIISNMSVWSDMESLVKFVYRNSAHQKIMRRKREWFEKINFHMVLWWIEAGHEPTLNEALQRLELFRLQGASSEAFSFRQPFACPGGKDIDPIMDKCA